MFQLCTQQSGRCHSTQPAKEQSPLYVRSIYLITSEIPPPPPNSSTLRMRALLNAIYPSLTTIMAHSSTEVIKPRLKSCGYKVSCYQIFIMLYGEVDYVFCTPIYIMVRTCETISTASAQTRRCAYRKVCDTAAVALHPSYPHTPIRPVPYLY